MLYLFNLTYARFEFITAFLGYYVMSTWSVGTDVFEDPSAFIFKFISVGACIV